MVSVVAASCRVPSSGARRLCSLPASRPPPPPGVSGGSSHPDERELGRTSRGVRDVQVLSGHFSAFFGELAVQVLCPYLNLGVGVGF